MSRYSVETIFKAVDRMTAPIDKMEKGVEKFSKKMESAAKKGAAMATAFVLGMGLAAKAAMTYHDELNNIGITAGMTADELKKLDKQVMSSAMAAGLKADDVLKGAGDLIAKGMDKNIVGAMLPALTATVIASRASMEDVAAATFTLNDALGITSEKMTDALGILITSGKSGAFEFNKMAQFLPPIGAKFKALGVQGEEAAATMGAALQIAFKGTGNADMAANNFQNFLSALTKPGTIKAVKGLGGDLEKVMATATKRGANPIEAAIEEIQRVTKGGKMTLLSEVAPDQQVKDFLIPMLQNIDEYKKIKAEALAATNVVAMDALKQGATAAASWGSLTAQFENAKIIVGTALLPAITVLSQTLSTVILDVMAWREANPELFDTLVKIATVAMLVVGGVGALMLSFSLIIGPIGLMVKAIWLIVTVVKALSIALITNPIILIIMIIIGLAALIIANWDVIGPFFARLWQGICDGLVAAKDFIVGVWDWLIAKVTGGIDKVMSLGQKVKSVFGGGGDINVNATGPGATGSAGHRAANSTHTEKSEVTIKVPNGAATQTKGKPGRGVMLQNTGGF